ncbi:hypothetical protein CVT26_002437 [Gymnopilus dilepis]|uniref:Zn(2)-C6 fungal-type domain-containing protein n=1 Tax=Gymnopilus dilepis TaxID=231916 RepID=A0A409Y3T9_9AGAR|nr:hypothetical protein CVT26_002437 [Gymnopilus dilepis]
MSLGGDALKSTQVLSAIHEEELFVHALREALVSPRLFHERFLNLVRMMSNVVKQFNALGLNGSFVITALNDLFSEGYDSGVPDYQRICEVVRFHDSNYQKQAFHMGLEAPPTPLIASATASSGNPDIWIGHTRDFATIVPPPRLPLKTSGPPTAIPASSAAAKSKNVSTVGVVTDANALLTSPIVTPMASSSTIPQSRPAVTLSRHSRSRLAAAPRSVPAITIASTSFPSPPPKPRQAAVEQVEQSKAFEDLGEDQIHARIADQANVDQDVGGDLFHDLANDLESKSEMVFAAKKLRKVAPQEIERMYFPQPCQRCSTRGLPCFLPKRSRTPGRACWHCSDSRARCPFSVNTFMMPDSLAIKKNGAVLANAQLSHEVIKLKKNLLSLIDLYKTRSDLFGVMVKTFTLHEDTLLNHLERPLWEVTRSAIQRALERHNHDSRNFKHTSPAQQRIGETGSVGQPGACLLKTNVERPYGRPLTVNGREAPGITQSTVDHREAATKGSVVLQPSLPISRTMCIAGKRKVAPQCSVPPRCQKVNKRCLEDCITDRFAESGERHEYNAADG